MSKEKVRKLENKLIRRTGRNEKGTETEKYRRKEKKRKYSERKNKETATPERLRFSGL